MRQFEAKSEKGSGLDFFFPSVLGTSEQNKCLQAAVASALKEDTSAADAVIHAAHRQCLYTLHENVYAYVC